MIFNRLIGGTFSHYIKQWEAGFQSALQDWDGDRQHLRPFLEIQREDYASFRKEARERMNPAILHYLYQEIQFHNIKPKYHNDPRVFTDPDNLPLLYSKQEIQRLQWEQKEHRLATSRHDNDIVFAINCRVVRKRWSILDEAARSGINWNPPSCNLVDQLSRNWENPESPLPIPAHTQKCIPYAEAWFLKNRILTSEEMEASYCEYAQRIYDRTYSITRDLNHPTLLEIKTLLNPSWCSAIELQSKILTFLELYYQLALEHSPPPFR